MKIEVKKWHLFIIVGVLLVLTAGVIVYAAVDTTKPYHDISQITGLAAKFGGAYGKAYTGGSCLTANPATGACTCPSGYTAVQVTSCGTFTGGVDMNPRCGFVCVTAGN